MYYPKLYVNKIICIYAKKPDLTKDVVQNDASYRHRSKIKLNELNYRLKQENMNILLRTYE